MEIDSCPDGLQYSKMAGMEITVSTLLPDVLQGM
jgi:hypothetical protein